MRRKITKEVIHTTVKVGRMKQGENGLPVAEALPEITLLGNVTLEKAQKEVAKDYPNEPGITVFEVQANAQKYEMDVLDFIKHGTPVSEEAKETAEDQTAE